MSLVTVLIGLESKQKEMEDYKQQLELEDHQMLGILMRQVSKLMLYRGFKRLKDTQEEEHLVAIVMDHKVLMVNVIQLSKKLKH